MTFLRLPSDRAAARPSLDPPVLEALEYLWSSGWKGRYLPEDAPLAAVGKGWERLLSGGNVDGEPGGKIERKAYALGTVEAPSDGLKRRDVRVAPSGGRPACEASLRRELGGRALEGNGLRLPAVSRL